MQAKTSIPNILTQWLAIALIALAPLACIAYCRVTHEVAHRTMDHAMMHNAGDAPLNDMQQLVQAVTDVLPMLMAWLTSVVVVAFHISLRVDALRVAHVPPTPPPKAVVFPFAFR